MIKEWLSNKKVFTFYLKSDGTNKKYRAEMLVIANAESFGTGAIINPAGSMHDGKFEIVIIKPYPWWSVFTLFVRFFLGNLHKMKYVKLISTKKCEIKLLNSQNLQVDGEVFENIDHLKIHILSKVLNIIY
jgi:diacylglycerol kinase family enzyme